MFRPRDNNGDAGNALVEFALAQVIILTVLFGVIDMGRALYAYNWVANAARQGTRFAMVRGAGCTKFPSGCPAHASDIEAYVDSTAIALDVSKVGVTSLCFVTGSAIGTAPPCGAGGPAYIQVTVTYDFKMVSPFIPLAWRMTSVSERTVQEP
jgi:hypothetical protein